jgi:signal transduction histidine kinase
VGAAHGHLLHGLDILWTSVLTFVSEGPVSPFFLFFLFVVLSAAYRWGFVGTVLTAGVTVAVFLVETAIAAAGPWNEIWSTGADFELNRTILRVTYLLLTGFLLGYLAEQDKASRTEMSAIAGVARQARVDLGLGGSVTAVARDLLRTFRARAVYFVLQDHESGDTSLWQIDPSAPGSTPDSLRRTLTGGDRAAWLFQDPGRAWHATRHVGDVSLRARVTEPGVWPLRRVTLEIPAVVSRETAFTRLIVANVGLPDEWRGRVYLCDPSPRTSVEQSVHFVEALAEHVTPALSNVFLLGRLRARVTAAERARVARELHDGAIQALIGIEMKVEAIRRGPDALPGSAKLELDEVQDLLRREVLALRELMQALRPIAMDASDQLHDVLASIVERFRRDSGVPARFVHSGGAVVLPPETALEIVHIVQEALVNIHKHSRASNALVRLAGGPQGCTVIIEDDGVGFEFEGHLSGEELDRRRIGPAIIKERARIVGARLAIESIHNAGARIELTLEHQP